nr:MAG TPA: Protein of unknown function (DUF3088) [Caudoviricetes sp.]
MAVTKNKINHARLCMMGGCRNKNTDLYSKRTNVFNGGLYLCPDCAQSIGLLSGLTEPVEETDAQNDKEEETDAQNDKEDDAPAVQTVRKTRSKA